MRLLNRFNRLNIAVTVVIMLITGFVYYYAIRNILTNDIDKDLAVEENEVLTFVKGNGKLPDVYKTNHQQMIFTPVGNATVKRRFVDTVYRETDDNDLETGRALISSVRVGNSNYLIQVMQSKVETEYLIKIIFAITAIVIIVLLGVLILLNRVILSRIWQPFYQVLSQLKAFSPTARPALQSIPSDIDEFRELNTAVTGMALRVQKEYQSLKSFTENASHELMTPIAVINSKLDTLVQTGDFNEKQSALLNDIYGTVARLTRLNRSMILLSKLENGLIQEGEETDLAEIMTECLNHQDEIIAQKGISIETDLARKPLKVSRSLMEVLFNNMISNAIRHNFYGGRIKVLMDEAQLTVSNTGNENFNFDDALQRFHKAGGSEGIGLGLTLCRQICMNYGFTFGYERQAEWHKFTIAF